MQVNIEEKDSITYIAPQGEIDINSSPDFKKNIDSQLTKEGAKVILVLDGVPYVDSSGLATFVEILKNLRKVNGQIALVGLSEKLKGLFAVTKLDKLFKILDSAEEAVSQFS